MKKTIAILFILFITMLAAPDLHAVDISASQMEAVEMAEPANVTIDRQPWKKSQNKINRQNIRASNKTARQNRRMSKKSRNNE